MRSSAGNYTTPRPYGRGIFATVLHPGLCAKKIYTKTESSSVFFFCYDLSLTLRGPLIHFAVWGCSGLPARWQTPVTAFLSHGLPVAGVGWNFHIEIFGVFPKLAN
jgi:hypothetical protein